MSQELPPLITRPSGLAEVPDVIGDTVDHAVRKNPSGLFEYKPKTYESSTKPIEYDVSKPLESVKSNYDRYQPNQLVDPSNATTTTTTVTKMSKGEPSQVPIQNTLDSAVRETTTTTVTRVENALVPQSLDSALPQLVTEQPVYAPDKPYIYRRTEPYATPYNLTNPIPGNPPYVYRRKYLPQDTFTTITQSDPVPVQPVPQTSTINRQSTHLFYSSGLAQQPVQTIKVPTPPLITNTGLTNGSSSTSYRTYYESSGSAANTGKQLLLPPQNKSSYSYQQSSTGPQTSSYSSSQTSYTTQPIVQSYSYRYEAPPVINQSKVVTESKSYTTSSSGGAQQQITIQPPEPATRSYQSSYSTVTKAVQPIISEQHTTVTERKSFNNNVVAPLQQQAYEYTTYNEKVNQVTQPVAEQYRMAKEEVREIVKPPTPHQQIYQEEIIMRAPSPPSKIYLEEARVQPQSLQNRIVKEEVVMIKPPTPPREIHQELVTTSISTRAEAENRVIEPPPVVVPPPSVRQYIVTETITTTTTHNEEESEQQSAVQVESVHESPAVEEITITENQVETYKKEQNQATILREPTPPPAAAASSMVTTTTVVQEQNRSQAPAVEKKRTLLYMAPPPKIATPLYVPPPPVPPTGILARNNFLPPTPQKRNYIPPPPTPPKKVLNLPPAQEQRRERSYVKQTRKINYDKSPSRRTEYHKVLELNYDQNPESKSHMSSRALKQINTSFKKTSSSLQKPVIPPPPEPPRQHYKDNDATNTLVSSKYISKSSTNGRSSNKNEIDHNGVYPPIRSYERVEAFVTPPLKYDRTSGTSVGRSYHMRSSNLEKYPPRFLEESRYGMNDREAQVVEETRTRGRTHSNGRSTVVKNKIQQPLFNGQSAKEWNFSDKRSLRNGRSLSHGRSHVERRDLNPFRSLEGGAETEIRVRRQRIAYS